MSRVVARVTKISNCTSPTFLYSDGIAASLQYCYGGVAFQHQHQWCCGVAVLWYSNGGISLKRQLQWHRNKVMLDKTAVSLRCDKAMTASICSIGIRDMGILSNLLNFKMLNVMQIFEPLALVLWQHVRRVLVLSTISWKVSFWQFVLIYGRHKSVQDVFMFDIKVYKMY